MAVIMIREGQNIKSQNEESVSKKSQDRPPSSVICPPAQSRGIRELALSGFDPVPIVALWRPEDSTRLRDPLQLIRGR